MQDQIYKILSSRSGKPLRQIIKDTKRNDFYLDAQKALEYGLIDAIVAGELPAPKPTEARDIADAPSPSPVDDEQPLADVRVAAYGRAGRERVNLVIWLTDWLTPRLLRAASPHSRRPNADSAPIPSARARGLRTT